MNREWKQIPLGDAFATATGTTPPKSESRLYGNFMPLVKPPELRNGQFDTAVDGLSQAGVAFARTLPTNSILVSCIGNLGNVGMNTVPVAFNQQINAILPNEMVAVPKFMLYQTLSPFFQSQLEALASGTTIPIVNKSKFNSIQIVLPLLLQQQRIVAILDETFAGIATAKANAERNLQNAREVFELRQASAMRRGGDGWLEMTVGEVCTLRSGTTVPTSIERSTGDVPYVKVAEMTMPANRDGVKTSIRFLNLQDIKPSWVIPAGAVIFPKRGGAILTNKKRQVLVDVCADLNIMSVIPSDKLTPEYLYRYFLTVDMRQLGSGSSIPQINNYDIAPLRIKFPESKKRQTEVAEAIKALEAECDTLVRIQERKLTALDELKQSLLHQAFSGQL